MNQNEKIIRLPEVIKMVGLKKSAIYKKIKANDFPAQFKLGKHSSGWLESAVQNWIKQRAGMLPANDEQHNRAA